MPQPGPWQQSGFNDMHLMQQHNMMNQMQELQRRQQLHQLGDSRQQNSLNQFPNLINGEPIHDASQMYMNWGHHGASPKGQMFSQEQGRTPASMGQVPQQHDISLYGTPVVNSGANLNRYPHLEGIPNNHGKSMHSSGFNTSFLGEHGFSKKNTLEQSLIQDLNCENFSENYQQANTQKKNVSLQESMQITPSQSTDTLDPLEKKILFGMNDTTWDSSLDGTEMGSWSALMQSAVADVSSSDTGLQEEWSGLTFQNMDLSADNNQPSNFVDNEKQHVGSIDSNFFPGFQHSSFQFSSEKNEVLHQNSSHVSNQKSPENIGHRLPCNTQRGLSVEGSTQVQQHGHLGAEKEHDSREKSPLRARDSQHLSQAHQESPKQGSQVLPNYGQRFFGSSNVFDNISNSAMNPEKMHFPETQVNASEDALSSGNLGSHGLYVPNSMTQTRENKPGFYQNVDHLRKDSFATHMTLADTPSAYTDQLCNQSSVSQGFNLRMAPPFERVANPNLLVSSQSSPQIGSSLNARLAHQDMGEKGHPWLTPPNFTQSRMPSHASSQREHHDVQVNSSAQSRTSPASLFQIQRQEVPNIPVTQPSIMSDMSQQSEVSAKPHNVWTNIPILPFSSPTNNNTPNDQNSQQEPNDQNSQHGGILYPELGAYFKSQQGIDRGEGQKHMFSHDQLSSNVLEPASQAGTLLQWQQSDVFHQNHSLMQQMHAMRNAGSVPGDSTQFNLVSSNINDQHVSAMTGHQSLYGHTSRVTNHMGNSDLHAVSQFPAGENLSFNAMNALPSQSNLQNIPSQELFKFEGNFQNSSQMANTCPQYGNFKMEQMQMSDTRTSEQFPFVRPSHGLQLQTSSEQAIPVIASQIENVWPSTAATLSVLSSDKVDQSMVVRPKKRKTATSELLPWHKEVTQTSQRLQNSSIAEIEWAQAPNRLTEKVEEKEALIENKNLLLRPKKRLIMTTQLMQQLLRPPPPAIFSVNATSAIDSVVYYVAKFTLGDACSLTSCLRSNYRFLQDKSNVMPLKLTTSESVRDEYFSKVMEDITTRTKKLENEFLRMEKKTSFVDFQLECQDLEKITVINRFAKFHIRGHADAAGISPKIFLQRHITPLPMPSRLPEGLNCLSL